MFDEHSVSFVSSACALFAHVADEPVFVLFFFAYSKKHEFSTDVNQFATRHRMPPSRDVKSPC